MLLILFFLVSQHFVVPTSSGCHSDRDKDNRHRVSCVHQGLTTVPDGIDLGTQTLVLSQNAFVSLSWATYTIFTDLHELDLSQNLISTIDQSGPVLGNLRVLRLSNNTLTGLGRAVFKSTPSLMEVYLDGNAIRSLDSATFSDLLILEVIDLSHNKLHILPSHLLKYISSTQLKHFNLQENNIQYLPDEFFASKPELPYVFLSANNWVCTCQVGYLQRYLDDQRDNVYVHNPPSTVENDPESVTCSSPATLKGRAIMNLTEDDYCNSDTNSQPPIPHTTPLTSAPTTAETAIIIQPKAITKVIPITTPTTIQPTAPNTVVSSTTSIPTITPTNIETTTPISTIPTTTTSSTAPTTTDPATPTTSTPMTTEKTTTKQTTIHPTTPNTVVSSTTSIPTITPTSIETTTPISTIPTTTTSSTAPTTVQPTPTTTDPITPTTSTPTTTEKTTTKQTTIQPTIPKPAESSAAPIPTTLTTNNPTTINLVTMVTQRAGVVLSAHGGDQRSVPWCWWLFITVLLLCIFSALFSCMLFLWLIIIYITLYRPIKRQAHSDQGVILRAYQFTADKSLTVDRTEDERVLFLPLEMIQETLPVFRSVLFISKGDEDGEADERREGTRNEDEEMKRGTDVVPKIDLLPAVTLHREQETETKDREEVFRKTLYRVISQEEEIEGWKEVEENCWGLTERDKGRKERGAEREKTRYSLILREKRGSVMEDRKGETEWLVGEWDMREGEKEIWGSLISMKEGCGLSGSAYNGQT